MKPGASRGWAALLLTSSVVGTSCARQEQPELEAVSVLTADAGQDAPSSTCNAAVRLSVQAGPGATLPSTTTVALATPVTFAIPAVVVVSAGQATDDDLTLRFGNAAHPVTCKYKGRPDGKPRPGAASDRYTFRSCSNGDRKGHGETSSFFSLSVASDRDDFQGAASEVLSIDLGLGRGADCATVVETPEGPSFRSIELTPVDYAANAQETPAEAEPFEWAPQAVAVVPRYQLLQLGAQQQQTFGVQSTTTEFLRGKILWASLPATVSAAITLGGKSLFFRTSSSGEIAFELTVGAGNGALVIRNRSNQPLTVRADVFIVPKKAVK